MKQLGNFVSLIFNTTIVFQQNRDVHFYLSAHLTIFEMTRDFLPLTMDSYNETVQNYIL